MTLYDDVEREARHDWLNERVREPAAPEPCPECGYDDCAGDCTRRVMACGPCCNCGDPVEPGESICHACAKAEAEEAL